jgi:hypothetical protein
LQDLAAQTNLLLAAKTQKEELTEQIEQAKSELSDLLNAEQTAAQATEAEALARAKTVRSNSCHDVL